AVVRANSPGWPKLWASGDQDKQRRQRTAFGNATKEIECGRVGPMNIFERQHDRLDLGACHCPIRERCQLSAPQFLGRQSQRPFLWQRNVEQWGKYRGTLHRVELDQRESVLQVCKPPLRRQVGAAEALASPLSDRMQWRVLQELRAAPFDPGVRDLAQPGMKLLDQPRLPQPRLADDQHQVPVALPAPLPAPPPPGGFFLAADKRSEMALSRAASAPTGSYKLEQRHRLRHAFQVMGPALFRHKQSSDLALHTRGNHDSARLR